MTSESTIREEIKRLIVMKLRLDARALQTIEDDTPLFTTFGLDSVDALELAVALEKTYGITIRSHEVDKQIFTSVRTLGGFVQQCLQVAGGNQPLNA